jgi:putative redox protein
MSLTATSRSVPGTLRQEVVVDATHRLVTDEPPSVGGDGSAPAPHELLVASLAACVSTTLVMFARRRGWDLGDVVVDVDYDQKSSPRRFRVTIAIGAPLTAPQLELLERVAAACPVRRSLETGFAFDERIVPGRVAA